MNNLKTNKLLLLPRLLKVFWITALLSTSVNALEVQQLDSPANGHSAQPHLSQTANGVLVLSWLEHEQGLATLRFAQWHDDSWQPAQTVASGSDWVVSWSEFPSVMPIKDDLWAAHWLVKYPDPNAPYAYNVAVSISNDKGSSWSELLIPHDDGTATEHGFVSLFPWQEGVGVMWLDGRNMAESEGVKRSLEQSGTTLRSVVITAQGELQDPQLIDRLVCDCCQTDAALSAHGPIAIYRNRTVDEVRDIYVARALDNQWKEPSVVNNDGWKIAGCPVNGPAIDAQLNRVAAAWFTGVDDQSRVRMAFSEDAGNHFSQAIEVDNQNPLGRVDIELLADDSAAVLWACTRDKAQALCLRRVSKDQQQGPIKQIQNIGQAGGFPQMALVDNQLVIAWVEPMGEVSRVRTARVPVDSL